MRPRGFVELTRRDKTPIYFRADAIVTFMSHIDGECRTWVFTPIEGIDYTVHETPEEVATAIDAAMRERERDTTRAARIAAIGCRREAMAARVEYYRCVNAERLANGCAIAYDGPLTEAAYALDALAAEAAALIEEDGK